LVGGLVILHELGLQAAVVRVPWLQVVLPLRVYPVLQAGVQLLLSFRVEEQLPSEPNAGAVTMHGGATHMAEVRTPARQDVEPWRM